ncbi:MULTISPECIES: ABC transporter permease [Ectothiorhodospira]|jgi:glycine betaine/proline transport system permease protein|uniref:Glycine betaine/proline transport system permease protein n=1 Tax=Ectothiorhodospira marina TaxID=1396821 RepID=A0A1H7JEN6_9GAMM|nr:MULTISPECIES: proline/glycine betaine ABC transporter permease [Ectothiorhodospira]MCG5517342.1 proline/glycine betaine ABC transporter permease [Ectothiorhodospira sp. 9100]MCG5520207.1 proline/glycine betaine ABC transporter permease [Ectothiorhodospira sp. 9905]SEK71835.1 glycine betaine/proline transport system permease protein [Ectothiorhodospira marina]
MSQDFPFVGKFPLSDYIDDGLDWLTNAFSGVTRAISNVLGTGVEAVVTALSFPPPWVVILCFAALAWYLAGRRVGIGTAAGLLFLWNLQLWEATVETFTLVLFATAVAVAIALPLGILGGLSDRFKTAVMPVLDFMQTMPAFVYLIPAIPFFGLGQVSAMFATVIFSMPPAIRLTILGIRQVPAELVEASDAFGANWRQKLFKVQMPLAIPTIMAGINQTIMLALSMVVIAAMIGAGGLGGEVWRAIQRLQPGNGFEAGIAIVILAMILDRVTQKIGQPKKKQQ